MGERVRVKGEGWATGAATKRKAITCPPAPHPFSFGRNPGSYPFFLSFGSAWSDIEATPFDLNFKIFSPKE